MSYTLTLECGCTVYVACDPLTRVAHARVIERIGSRCGIRRHEVGLKLWAWELLPQPPDTQSNAALRHETGFGANRPVR